MSSLSSETAVSGVHHKETMKRLIRTKAQRFQCYTLAKSSDCSCFGLHLKGISNVYVFMPSHQSKWEPLQRLMAIFSMLMNFKDVN